MKWYWKIYKINGSFKIAVDDVCGEHHKYSEYLDSEYYKYSSVFVAFDGTRHGVWYSSPTDYSYRTDYEFKGNVGLKEIRKQKFDKLKKDGKIL